MPKYSPLAVYKTQLPVINSNTKILFIYTVCLN